MSITRHPELLRDHVAMAAMRLVIRSMSKSMSGTSARDAFDGIMEKTPAAPGVTYEEEEVGGVSGWWCLPATPLPRAVILYLHGGAYGLGSAKAFRNFVSDIAARTSVATFIADYALAPEHPFPAAVNDATAVYMALAGRGVKKIALAGDSSGGGLALVLLASMVARSRARAVVRPVGAAVMSPWTDLALTGDSVRTRSEADPLLNEATMRSAAKSYLGNHDAKDPLASPLYDDLRDLPPIRIHVGEDEILLDDSIRYGEKLEGEGGTIEVHTWKGMVHVFPSNLGFVKAAKDAMEDVGVFLESLFR